MTEHRTPERIPRYTANERTSHWLTAIGFVLAALSGLALYHPALNWLAALFGGGPWTRILHPFIGTFMFIVFALLALRMWGHNRIEPRDREWMGRTRDVIHNREENLPEVGRYNGGQKMLFFGLVLSMAGLLLTGIVMWRPWLAELFPVTAIRWASLLHAFFATVLIVMIIVHVYAAFWVKGAMDAMLRGSVTRGWARRHHSLWLREVDEERRRAAGK